MPSVESNGISIEYVDEGAGDPLLLVMGLGGQLIDWPRDFVDHLIDVGFRVIRLDNRDAGLSSLIDAPAPTTADMLKAFVSPRWAKAAYTVPDMAADAVGLLDALDIESAHVAGVSMGGMISQQMAIDAPGRVRSLTSIMSTTGNRRAGRPKLSMVRHFLFGERPTRETAAELSIDTFEAFSGPTFDREEFRPYAERAVERSFRPAGVWRQLAGILASPDRTPGLERLDVPAVVIHGAVDPLVTPSGGIATANAIPGSRLLMFNDMGHDLPTTRRREIAEAIHRNATRS